MLRVSPGRATSQRQALEIELQAVVAREMRRFLLEVERDAFAALDSPVLLAAATERGERRVEPFTLGAVLGAWSVLVDRVVQAITQWAGAAVDNPFLGRVRERLLSSEGPGAVFIEVSEVLGTSMTEQWTLRQTHRNIRASLLPEEWRGASGRVARTEATAVFNHAALADLVERGETRKQWVAHHDYRTRETHLEADGQIVGAQEAFIVGGEALMYPCDPSGSAEETANCRCVLVGVP